MNVSLEKVNPEQVSVIDNQNLVALGTLQATNPTALVNGASEMAKELAKVIQMQGLYINIKGKSFVTVEGWTTLATMLGCVAREIETTEENGVYVATVELVRLSDGLQIGKASAECGEESPWSKRAKYARRSMAQTRATSKACRLAFSWVMKLSGYEVTPAEEMTPLQQQAPQQRPQKLITDYEIGQLTEKCESWGIELKRVGKWIQTAWNISNFNGLTFPQFYELSGRIEKWSGQIYEQEAKVTGLHEQIENAENAVWNSEYSNIRAA